MPFVYIAFANTKDEIHKTVPPTKILNRSAYISFSNQLINGLGNINCLITALIT